MDGLTLAVMGVSITEKLTNALSNQAFFLFFSFSPLFPLPPLAHLPPLLCGELVYQHTIGMGE